MRLHRRRPRAIPGQIAAGPDGVQGAEPAPKPKRRRHIDRFEVAELAGTFAATVAAYERFGAWAAWAIAALALLAYGALEGPTLPTMPTDEGPMRR